MQNTTGFCCSYKRFLFGWWRIELKQSNQNFVLNHPDSVSSVHIRNIVLSVILYWHSADCPAANRVPKALPLAINRPGGPELTNKHLTLSLWGQINCKD